MFGELIQLIPKEIPIGLISMPGVDLPHFVRNVYLFWVLSAPGLVHNFWIMIYLLEVWCIQSVVSIAPIRTLQVSRQCMCNMSSPLAQIECRGNA